jgi:hypothetical protein
MTVVKYEVQIVVDLVLAVSVVASVLMLICSNRNLLLAQKEERRREMVTNHLVSAYRKLEAACNTQKGSSHFRELDGALADMQLLGSEKQIALAHEFMKEFSGNGDLGAVLAQLRNELRQEIGLDSTASKLLFFRSK